MECFTCTTVFRYRFQELGQVNEEYEPGEKHVFSYNLPESLHLCSSSARHRAQSPKRHNDETHRHLPTPIRSLRRQSKARRPNISIRSRHKCIVQSIKKLSPAFTTLSNSASPKWIVSHLPINHSWEWSRWISSDIPRPPGKLNTVSTISHNRTEK